MFYKFGTISSFIKLKIFDKITYKLASKLVNTKLNKKKNITT